jgi:UPF0271 protein
VIDLNADLGEGGDDAPLYAWISSANIACGGHAGDAETMRAAVRLAVRHGVSIGAHPSYPDREGFGRVTRNVPPHALSLAIAGQLAALVQVAEALGARVSHVKPHGALYGDAASRPEIALALAEGVASVANGLFLVGLAGSSALRIWSEYGFSVAAEGFADRAYAANGTLVPRAKAGAVITNPADAAAQAIRLAEEGSCATLCVHADTEGAAAIAAAVRRGLEEAGFTLAALARRERRT